MPPENCPDSPPDTTRSSSWPSQTFLGQLSPVTRQAVLRLGTLRHFASDDVVLQEGGPSDCAFLLTAGLFKVSGSMGSGREALVAIRAAGDLVGELGLADGQPRSATVRAAGIGRGRRIGERAFYIFLADYPDASRAVNRAMAGKLRAATRRRVEFASFTAQARMARVLLELNAIYGKRARHGFELDVDLTQPELAALVGVGEATIHRILAGLRQGGVLDTGYRRIHLLDVDHLRNLAEE